MADTDPFETLSRVRRRHRDQIISRVSINKKYKIDFFKKNIFTFLLANCINYHHNTHNWTYHNHLFCHIRALSMAR